MKYVDFDILKVAERCGIEIYKPSIGRNEVTAKCPFCDDRHHHLSFKIPTNQFRCNKCVKTGNAVTLYGSIFNLSNLEAFEELSSQVIYRQPDDIYKPKIINLNQADLFIRHNVYSDFLNLLNLADNHRNNLRKRGMPDLFIEKFMYKSIPLDTEFRKSVLKQLSDKHNLYGIPGFFADNMGNWQMYLLKQGGIYVPVCDKDGYIQGLQIRLDNADKNKYRWFSSNHYNNGTKASTWVHTVGDISSSTAYLTEGALKADISSILSNGRLFIAVSGVNCIEKLPKTLKALNIRKVIEMYDMDKHDKKTVNDAVIRVKKLIEDMGIEYIQYSWDENFKGVDDYLLYYSNRRKSQQNSLNMAA